MTNLLLVGLTNAVLASALAVLVLCVTRIWKNPHLAHGLWLLVLLKLLSPPLLSIPVSVPGVQPSKGFIRIEDRTAGQIPRIRVDSGDKLATVPNVLQQQALAAREPLNNRSNVEISPFAWTVLFHLVAVVWLVGSLIWASVVAWRVWGFQRMLRHAEPPSRRLSHLAETVRVAMGLKACPVLLVVDGRLAPLVWPVGRKPRVVLPRRIVERFQEDELQAILAHEFAHLVRRDPWVRWLELVAGLVYWWHPVLWLARKQIRFAEEACCDALVVRRFAQGNPNTYAGTLLKVVESSSGLLDPAPSVASGLAAKGPLQRRIEMMLEGKTKSRMPVPAKVALVALALIALPLSAEAWQAEETQAEPVASGAGTDQKESDQPVADEKAAEAVAQPSKGEKTAEAIDRDVPSVLETETDRNVRASQRRTVEVPEAPYHIAPGDLLEIRVLNTFKESPIDKTFIVEPSGKVALGPPYGRVRVEGSTLEEAEELVRKHLDRILRQPEVSLTLCGWEEPHYGAAARVTHASPASAEAVSELLSKLLLVAFEMTESVGVLRQRVRYAETKYERIKHLHEQDTVSLQEFEKAGFEYELSKLRLRQGERALRMRRSMAKVAEVEYQKALEINQRAPGTIPKLELERLRIVAELARAKADELAE